VIKSWIKISVLLIGFITFLNHKIENKTDYSDWLREVYSTKPSKEWPRAKLHNMVNDLTFMDIGILPKVEFPKDNPYSDLKSELGKTLFFDPRLSSNGSISCATCHDPKLGWTDGKAKSVGHNGAINLRNSMPIINAGYSTSLFWDGRANSLEHQAKFPIEDPKEMHENLEVAVERIAKIPEYQKLFKQAFSNKKVNSENLLKAIATFERTIVSKSSRFDRFISGESELFTDEEVRGLHLFRTKAGCINCHHSPLFSDNKFHNDGLSLMGMEGEDLGKYNHTRKSEDSGLFRTPSLREVAKTGPWMHNGIFDDLFDLVEYYNQGNPNFINRKNIDSTRINLIPEPTRMLMPLRLSKEEVSALVSFLGTLSSDFDTDLVVKLPN
jgi:cytochrome c peroxidase